MQRISADGRFFNMKMTMFALVLAIGMAFSAFAADEPQKIELEGVNQQLPAGRLFGCPIRNLDGLSESRYCHRGYQD